MSEQSGRGVPANAGKRMLRLDLVDDDSIADIFGQPLGARARGMGIFPTVNRTTVDHVALKFGENLLDFEGRRTEPP